MSFTIFNFICFLLTLLLLLGLLFKPSKFKQSKESNNDYDELEFDKLANCLNEMYQCQPPPDADKLFVDELEYARVTAKGDEDLAHKILNESGYDHYDTERIYSDKEMKPNSDSQLKSRKQMDIDLLSHDMDEYLKNVYGD